MVNTVSTTQQTMFGVFELDTMGTIVYSRPANGQQPQSIVGRNFFEDVAPFKNISAFRRHIDSFARNDHRVESFNFNCQFDEVDTLPIKVMLVRISEREQNERTKLTIVDIRRA
jgi:hypothetical protein